MTPVIEKPLETITEPKQAEPILTELTEGETKSELNEVQKEVHDILATLAVTEQQEVLDFIEFLLFKKYKAEYPGSLPNLKERLRQPKQFLRPDGTPMSLAEAFKEYAGCLDGGPSDLSYNKKYLGEFKPE